MHARRVAFWCGVLGGIALLLAALGTLLGGLLDLALGRAALHGIFAAAGTFFVEVVVGFLMFVFAAMGTRRSSETSIAAGVAMIVLALVTWLFVGLSALLLIGGLLALLSGIFLVVERN